MTAALNYAVHCPPSQCPYKNYSTTPAFKTYWVDISSKTITSLPPTELSSTEGYNGSSTLYESEPGSTFSAPFTCTQSDNSLSYVQAIFYSPTSSDNYLLYTSYSGATNNSHGIFMTSRYYLLLLVYEDLVLNCRVQVLYGQQPICQAIAL